MGCPDHKKPLPKQTSSWNKYKCFEELLHLADLPSCYNASDFRDFCRDEAEKCLGEVLGPPATRHTQSQTNLRATRSVPATPRRATCQPSHVKRTPGRPPLPRVDHPLYTFYRDGASPLSLEVPCVVDANGLARFRYDLPQVRTALIKVLGPNTLKRKFEVWVSTKRDWSPAPKASEEQLLLPGEGRVYKLRDVSDLPGLERYKFLALPRAERLAIDPEFMAPIPHTMRHANLNSSEPDLFPEPEMRAIPDDDNLTLSARDSSPAPEPPPSSLPSTPARASTSQNTQSMRKRPADDSESLAIKQRRLARQRIAAVLGVPEPDEDVADAWRRPGKGKGKATTHTGFDSGDMDDSALTDEEVATLFWST